MKKKVLLLASISLALLWGLPQAAPERKTGAALLAAKSLSVPASAFHPARHTARFQRDFGVLINVGEQMPYVAPVYLPQGATLLTLELQAFDGWRDGGLNLKLVTLSSHIQYQILGELETPTEWAEGEKAWSVSASSARGSAHSYLMSHRIEESRGYTLYLIMPEISGPDPSLLRFAGARITYAVAGGSDTVTRER